MRRAGLTLAAALATAALAAPAGAGAAAIDVSTTADEYGSGSGCSLREAVRAANDDVAFGGCAAGESAAADAIRLAPGALYPLTVTGPGEQLNATGDLDLETGDGVSIGRAGPGARPTIDANDLELPPSSHDRAIDLHGSGSFTLEAVRILDGDAGLESGGAMRWAEAGQPGDLEVRDSELAGNSAIYGSAIEAETTGEHLVEDSSISGGTAADLGAIHSTGRLNVLRTSITGNGGGGIAATKPGADSLRLTASTIAGNPVTVAEAIGAVYSDGDTEVVNSTISGNGGGFVGGIEAHGALEVSFSTIADNQAVGGGGHASGGIDVDSAASVSLDAVILSGNKEGFELENCNEPVDTDLRPSLEDGNLCGLATSGPEPSLAGTDPQLAPLAANGGPTQTRGLYPGSPAIDVVDGCGLGAVDQRGAARPSDGCDIGAFEGSVPRPPDPPPAQPAPAPKKKKKKKKCKRRKATPTGAAAASKRGKCKSKPKRRAAPNERRVIGRSVDGRAIRAVRVGDPAADRVALVVGVIHGDERAGLAVTRELRALGPAIDAQVWVIDSLNPDGARARTRRNSRGVDLNRNFPYRWRGGVPRSSGYYPGPRAASEPETRAAMDFIREIDPDISVWYHQPWGAVLACRGRPAIAARYAKLAKMGTSCRGRGLHGTAISWEKAALGSDAFVVELAAGRISGASARRHARAAATIAEGT